MAKEGTKAKSEEVAAPAEQSAELLRPDKKNARRMPRERRAKFKYALAEFGDLSGIVWNELLGDLVGGHQRMDVLRGLGAKSWVRLSPDEGYIEHPKTGERFRIRIVRWEEEKHRAAQLVANNPHLQGEFTEDVVSQLRELEETMTFNVLGLDELQKQLDKDADEMEEQLNSSSSGGNLDLPEKFLVIVECKDDRDQAALLEKLQQEGRKVRSVVQ